LCTALLFRVKPIALSPEPHFDVPKHCGNVIVELQRIGVPPVLINRLEF
jgi:hypothetical protein